MTPRVVWATNLAAPYRLPVWRRLGELVDLDIWLLAKNESNRHWGLPVDPGFDVSLLRTGRFNRGGEPQYFLAAQPSVDLTRPVQALVLPSWQYPAAWQLLRWAERRGIATLAFNESTLASRRHDSGLIQQARRRFYAKVDHVITVSPASTEAIESDGVEPHRITQTSNAVDVELFTSAKPSSTPDSSHRFVYCGQLIDRKQPLLVVEAFAAQHPSSLLEIVGDGPLEADLRRLVKDLSLESRVTLHGHLEPREVAGVFAASDTLVMPSTMEVHGLVAQEALAAGMNVVVSAGSGVASLINGSIGAWCVEPELADVVAAMAESSRTRGDRMPSPLVSDFTPHAMARAVHSAMTSAVISADMRTNVLDPEARGSF